MKKTLIAAALIFHCLPDCIAQNGKVGSGFGTNNWSTTDNFSASAGTSRIYTSTANGTGNQYFRLVTNWSGNYNQWGPSSSSSDYQITPGTSVPTSEINENYTSKAYYINVSSTSHNYVFKTREGGNPPPSKGLIVFCVQGTIASISGISNNLSTVYLNQSPTITASLSTAFSTGQGAYLRYTTDGWTTSTVVAMTGSGTTYTTSIPSQPAGTTVIYYAFTSGNDLSISGPDADLYTINLINNSGSNYSYTVQNAITTTGSGASNWSSTSTWAGGTKPSNGQTVVIDRSVTLDENVTLGGLTINSGATFIASDASARTITISRSSNGSSTTLSNAGTWNNGSGGSTVVFTGAPSAGDAVHSTSGDIPFQNITINKTSGSSNVGLAVGAGGTISGTLEIGAGGFVNAAPPTGFYLSSAILKFNQGDGAIYDVNSGDFSWSTTETPDNITITSGTVRLNGDRTATGNLLIDGGALVLNTGNPTLTIQGNWTRSSGTFTPNQGSIVLSGSSNSTIDIDGAAASMYNLTIDKSGGATVTLDNSMIITNTLTLTNGSIILGASNLTIGSSGSISVVSPSASKMIVASGAGKLIKNFSASGSFTFPIGDNTGTAEYSPITLNFTSGSFAPGSASVSLTDNTHPSITTTDKLSRYWSVSTSGITGFTCAVTASYLDADIVGNENNLWSMKYDGSAWTYGTQVNAGTNTLTFNTTSFSDFTAGNNLTLPVTFTSLTGSIRNGRAQLSWNIADEVNVDHYEVEESADGRRFQSLTQVDAAGRSSYQAIDAQLALGVNYYRVKAVDIDGKLTYSKIIRLENSTLASDVRLYPNPSQGELNLGLNIPAGNYQIRVINAVGQTVFQQPLTHEGGSRSLPLSLPKLNAGIYQVEVRGGVEKFVKSVRIE